MSAKSRTRGAWITTLLCLLGLRPSLAPAQDVPEVKVSVAPAWTDVVPGEIVPIAIVLDHKQGWHVHTNKPVPPRGVDAGTLIPTEIHAEAPSSITLGDVQWPASVTVPIDLTASGKPQPYAVFAGRAIAYLPIRIDLKSKPGDMITFPIAISYQACNDRTCLLPEDLKLDVSLKVIATAPARSLSGDFTNFDTPAAARSIASGAKGILPPATTSADSTHATTSHATGGASFFGLSLAGTRGPTGFAILALLGIAGGLVLNLTPCVLPVIPIKVLTLTQHAGSHRRTLVLAAWMSLGVIAFWLGLGIPAAFISAFADPSRIFGIWYITTAIGVVIAAMGLGIMGLFMINLPQRVYAIDPKASTPGGSFLFGVMTAVLGLPCFGFVAGALLPAAAAIGKTATITVFAAMGVGMALPYALLAANPKWLKRVPRTGPASELVKQVMGLLMLAAAAYFIGSGLIALNHDAPWIGPKLHWIAIAIFGIFAGGWLMVRTIQITKKPARRVIFGALGVVLALGAVWPAWSLTSEAKHEYLDRARAMAGATNGQPVTGVWNQYSDALVSGALASGKTVVMDFTAEWCLNCKTLKAAVLDREPVRSALRSGNVVMVEVDLTSTKAPGWEKLKALGQRGIPLLTVQGPGLAEPWMSGAYTSEEVMDALKRSAPRAEARRD
jgi:thiol:disulfide interchange protein DsbD